MQSATRAKESMSRLPNLIDNMEVLLMTSLAASHHGVISRRSIDEYRQKLESMEDSDFEEDWSEYVNTTLGELTYAVRRSRTCVGCGSGGELLIGSVNIALCC